MLTKEQRQHAFELFRESPYTTWKDVAEGIKVSYPVFVIFMSADKDFRKSIDSLQDARDGKVGA